MGSETVSMLRQQTQEEGGGTVDWEEKLESIWAGRRAANEQLAEDYICCLVHKLDTELLAQDGGQIPIELAHRLVSLNIETIR